MTPALIGLATQVGAPLVADILRQKLGGSSGDLVASVVERIAQTAGVSVEDVELLAASNPDAIGAAIVGVEQMAPELIALYAQGLETQLTMFEAEQEKGWFAWAWRPGWQWFLMALWGWQCIVLHVLNAIFKIALPPMDWAVLLQLTGFYFALYMGGHTLKDVVGKWAASRPAAKV